MLKNTQYKFIFCAEPHTASRAVTKALKTLRNSEIVGDHQHLTLEKSELSTAGYVSFSVIRDPREIIATMIACKINELRFAQKYDQGRIVERFVKWGCKQEKFFRHNDCDYTIRYPRWNDLNGLLRWLGVENPITLPLVGVTKGKKPWFKYFTPEQIRRMHANIPEIDLFRSWG